MDLKCIFCFYFSFLFFFAKKIKNFKCRKMQEDVKNNACAYNHPPLSHLAQPLGCCWHVCINAFNHSSLHYRVLLLAWHVIKCECYMQNYYIRVCMFVFKCVWYLSVGACLSMYVCICKWIVLSTAACNAFVFTGIYFLYCFFSLTFKHVLSIK